LKVLLTGATGFVGSHILDSLRARAISTAILLRSTSNRQFIQHHIADSSPSPREERAGRGADFKLLSGSITDPSSLPDALTGITHVIHCAGATKAQSNSEFFEINQQGTRNLLDAINSYGARIERFIHISSLAAFGPAVPNSPARESDTPQPVSTYGRSKLAAEDEVRAHCRGEFVILRPPGVYGPRDTEFLRLFRAVKRHILPQPSDRQSLSMVYVKDLAEAAVTCLQHKSAAGKTYFVAQPEITTARQIANEIAKQAGGWTIPCPLPTAALWPICLGQEILTRLTGKANVLSLQKFAELRAPGWVCDPSLLERETGFRCATALPAGIAETLAWYQKQRWL
jgi:nucleoside-diphosphate-sugar epimerase